jgi:hypothetical protein
MTIRAQIYQISPPWQVEATEDHRDEPRIPSSVRCPYRASDVCPSGNGRTRWFRVTFGLAFQPPIVRSALRLPVSSVDLSVRSSRLLGTNPYATLRQSIPPGTFDPFSSGPAALVPRSL